MPSKLALTPKDALSRVSSATSAEWSRAFVGMHPLWRQVPPILSRSISATDLPSSAALSAQA